MDRLAPKRRAKLPGRGNAPGQIQKLSSVGKFHVEPPFTSFDDLVGDPITGSAGCCALAPSGHAAVPPSSVMNSRHFASNCEQPHRSRYARIRPLQ